MFAASFKPTPLHETLHPRPSHHPLHSSHRLSPAGDNRIEFDEFEQAFLIFAQDQNKDDGEDNDEGNSAEGAAAGRAVTSGGAGGAREAAIGRSVAVDEDWENIATPPLTPAAREGDAGGKGGVTADGITDDITTIFMEERKGLIARITALEEDKAALGAEKEALAEDVRTHCY